MTVTATPRKTTPVPTVTETGDVDPKGRGRVVTVAIGEDADARGTFLRAGVTFFEICWKCGGRCYLPGYEHIDSARCWGCGAQGVTRTIGDLDAVAKLLRGRASRARTARRKAEKAEAEYAARLKAETPAWRAANADLVTFCESYRPDVDGDMEPYLLDLIKVVRDGGMLIKGTTDELSREVRRTRARRERAAASGWIGTEGTRGTFTFTVKREITFDSFNPYRHRTELRRMFIFADADGREAVWFDTSWGADFAEGDEITVTARVAEHYVSDRDFNRGSKQTRLTHVKVKTA